MTETAEELRASAALTPAQQSLLDLINEKGAISAGQRGGNLATARALAKRNLIDLTQHSYGRYGTAWTAYRRGECPELTQDCTWHYHRDVK